MSNPWSFFKNVYVISLKDATERRAYMKEMLDTHPGLDYTLIDAINGKKNPYLRYSYKTRGIIGEYEHGEGVLGCLASHRMVWERILYETESIEPFWTLIMEDDVKFHPLLTPELLSSYFEAIPKDARMLKIGYLGSKLVSGKVVLRTYVPVNQYWVSFQENAYSTICYAVRSDLIPHLLAHKWNSPIDHLRIPCSYGMINVEDVLEVPTNYEFRQYCNSREGRVYEQFRGNVAEQTFESQIFDGPVVPIPSVLQTTFSKIYESNRWNDNRADIPASGPGSSLANAQTPSTNAQICKVMYINLDKRTDRRAELEGELAKMGMIAERFPAIQGKTGMIGCGLSHIAVLKRAIVERWENVLILEDDFQFLVDRDTFEKQLTRFFNSNSTYDVVMLSYNLISSVPKDDLVSYVKEAQTASGYLVHKRFYGKLLANLEEGSYKLSNGGTNSQHANDQYWKSLQPTSEWFCFNMRIGRQRPSYSDIELRQVDYSSVEPLIDIGASSRG